MTSKKLSQFGKKLTTQENREFIDLITGANDDRLDLLHQDMATMTPSDIYSALLTASVVRGDVYAKLLSITLKFYGGNHPFGVTETSNLFRNLLSISGVATSFEARIYFVDMLVDLVSNAHNKLNLNLLLECGLNTANVLKNVDETGRVDQALAGKLEGLENTIALRDVFINSILPKCLETCLGRLNDPEFNKSLYIDLAHHDKLSYAYLSAFISVIDNKGVAALHRDVMDIPDSSDTTLKVMRKVGEKSILDEVAKQRFVSMINAGSNPPFIDDFLTKGFDLNGFDYTINFVLDNISKILKNSNADLCHDFLMLSRDSGRMDELINTILDDFAVPRMLTRTQAANELLTTARGPAATKARAEHLRDDIIMSLQCIGLENAPQAIRAIDSEAFATLWPFVKSWPQDEDRILALFPASKKVLISNSLGL